jgi:hypothetical protein
MKSTRNKGLKITSFARSREHLLPAVANKKNIARRSTDRDDQGIID